MKHGFAAGQYYIFASESVYLFRYRSRITFGDPLLFLELLITRQGVVLMWKTGAHPVPGVVRIAPDAMQIAQGRTHEYGRYADTFTFSLDGMENLGQAVEPRQFEPPTWG